MSKPKGICLEKMSTEQPLYSTGVLTISLSIVSNQFQPHQQASPSDHRLYSVCRL